MFSLLRMIYSLLSGTQRRQAGLLLGFMIVGMVMETIGVGLVVPAIAVLVQPDLATTYPAIVPVVEFLGSPTQNQLVTWGLVALVILYFTKAVFLAFLARRQMGFAFDAQVQLSQRLYVTYLRQPYPFHLQRNSAQLILNVTNEVNLFTFNVMLPAILLLTEGLIIVGIGGLLLYLEPTATVFVAISLGAAAGLFDRMIRARRDAAANSRHHHEGLKLQHLQQGLGGAKEVALLGLADHFARTYAVHNVNAAQAGRVQQTLQLFPRLWLELLGAVGLAGVVMLALVQGRDLASTVPAVALFAAAAFRLMPSANRVLNSVQSLRFGIPLVANLYEELQLPVSQSLAESPNRPAAVFEHEIRLCDLTYVYPGGSVSALTGVSLVIQKGEAVGVVGRSGAGKSTLVDVVLGLLPPTAGHVEVDGRDIRLELRRWQSQAGYVPQSIYLTDDTLRRNVAFGLRDDQIDDAAVGRAIRAAQLGEFVQSLPDGLQTIVGERGVRLSGGQRQRIGIARALYNDPAVLILDEATSALDVATESGIMSSVMSLRGSKTVIIVAHRHSTIEQCDRLYRLEAGRLLPCEKDAGSLGFRAASAM